MPIVDLADIAIMVAATGIMIGWPKTTALLALNHLYPAT